MRASKSQSAPILEHSGGNFTKLWLRCTAAQKYEWSLEGRGVKIRVATFVITYLLNGMRYFDKITSYSL